MILWAVLFTYLKIIFNDSAFTLIFSSFLAQTLLSRQALLYGVNEIEKVSVSVVMELLFFMASNAP